jgi:hypothetical protein
MRKILIVATTAVSLVAVIPAYAGSDNTEPRGGIDIGPMGQCFDVRACGHPGREAYGLARGCQMIRERMTTDNGRVIYKRHRVCN